MELQFVSHIAAGMAEQDVYIERTDVPAGQVIRPEVNDAKNPLQPLYASTNMALEDPFRISPNPLGPFPKSDPLNMTLGHWLAATGSGSYTVTGDKAELNLKFEHLVPNGSYTLLTPRISFPPNFAVQPGLAGAPDGSQATFHADALGNAVFNLKMKPLPESTSETATAVILAYNCEGEWRGEPGKNMHMQIFFFMPPPTGL